MSILGTFQPDTLITGVAPCKSAQLLIPATCPSEVEPSST